MNNPEVSNFNHLTTLPAFDTEWGKNVPYVFGNLVIVIEFLAGDERSKKKEGGITINGIMPSAYGFIVGTTDAHGEEIDMYLAPMADASMNIYVIDQVDPSTGIFDEHKVMLGFGSVSEAEHTYMQVFADGSGEKRLGAMVPFTPEAFALWLDTDGSALKPASQHLGVEDVVEYAGVKLPGLGAKDMPKPRDEVGGVIVTLCDLARGPKIKTVVNDHSGFDHHLYLHSALDMINWSNAIDVACRTLDFATPDDTFHIHLATPGGSVVQMGRMISAMKRTAAKVITYAEGIVASAGVTIWAAGHERHISPGAYFMQHMSSQLLADKTTNIANKSIFCMAYIERVFEDLAATGLFTQEEITAMSEGSFDVYLSGKEAIARIGTVSSTLVSVEA